MKKTAGMLKSKTASISFKVVTFYGMLVLLILAFLGCLLFSYLQSQFERERKQMLEGSLSQVDLLFLNTSSLRRIRRVCCFRQATDALCG